MPCPNCGARGCTRKSRRSGRRRCTACGETWLPQSGLAKALIYDPPRIFRPRLLLSLAALEAFIAQAPPHVGMSCMLLAEELCRPILGSHRAWNPDQVAQGLMTPWRSDDPRLVLACRSTLDRAGLDPDLHQEYIRLNGDFIVTAAVNLTVLMVREQRSKAITSGLLKVGAVALGAVFGAWLG
jgi:hypothetical protein